MGLKPKSKDHANFYECCDLTKKVYLIHINKKITLMLLKRNRISALKLPPVSSIFVSTKQTLFLVFKSALAASQQAIFFKAKARLKVDIFPKRIFKHFLVLLFSQAKNTTLVCIYLCVAKSITKQKKKSFFVKSISQKIS